MSLACVIFFLLHQLQCCSPISILPHAGTRTFIPESTGRSICTLQPLENGIYLGVNKVAYDQAVECCQVKGLDIVEVDNSSNEVVRWALLTGNYLQTRQPVGKRSGVYVRKDGSCGIAYLGSWSKPGIIIEDISCDGNKSFLCEDRDRGIDCSDGKYTEVELHDGEKQGLVFSHTKMSWVEALRCCESRNQTLLRLHPSSTLKILGHVGKFLEPKNSCIWTSGYRTTDLGLGNQFRWGDNYDVSVLHGKGSRTWDYEFCVAAEVRGREYKGAIRDRACEKKLHFVCETAGPCSCEHIDWREIPVNLSSQNYVYAGNAKLSFDEAQACCRSKSGYRLLSVISISEGDALGVAMDKNPETEYKFSGRYNGVWVGARRIEGSTFNYMELRGSPNYTLGGGAYSRYEDRVDGGGDCLVFFLDARMSFVLAGEACGVRRGVVCELQTEFMDADNSEFVDVGNRYFYSKNAHTQQDANDTCMNHNMRLVEIGDKEEMGVLIQGVSQFFNHTSYMSGFWSGDKRYVIPLHDLPHSLAQMYIRKRWEDRDLHAMHHDVDEYFGMMRVANRCHEAFWMQIGNEVVMEQWKRDCSRAQNFVCQVGVGGAAATTEEYLGGRRREDSSGCGGMSSRRGRDPDIWVSSASTTWDNARKCCSMIKPEHSFELVGMDSVSMHQRLNDHAIANIDLYEQISGLGFWTCGTNVLSSRRFAWLGGGYTFLREDALFYNGYLTANESVGDEGQCLEAFYSGVDGGLRVIGKSCRGKSQFVCARKLNGMREYPSCESVVYERIGDSSFFLSWDRMPWLRAADCCYQRNSQLAKIDSRKTSAYVARSLLELFKSNNETGEDFNQGAWTGLFRTGGNLSDFTWLDGVVINVDKYGLKHGVKNESQCVGVYASNDHQDGLVWKVVSCYQELRSICHSDSDAIGVSDYELE